MSILGVHLFVYIRDNETCKKDADEMLGVGDIGKLATEMSSCRVDVKKDFTYIETTLKEGDNEDAMEYREVDKHLRVIEADKLIIDKSKVLGSGGHGVVYQGKLNNAEEVAVNVVRSTLTSRH